MTALHNDQVFDHGLRRRPRRFRHAFRRRTHDLGQGHPDPRPLALGDGAYRSEAGGPQGMDYSNDRNQGQAQSQEQNRADYYKDLNERVPLSNNYHANRALMPVCMGLMVVFYLVGPLSAAVQALPPLPHGAVRGPLDYPFLSIFFAAVHSLGAGVLLSRLFAFTMCYLLFTYVLSPDIDHRNHPGINKYPFIPLIGWIARRRSFIPRWLWVPRSFLCAALRIAHIPLNKLWRAFCYPLGRLFTHRGVIHWPFIGTAVKVSYLYLFIWGAALAWRYVSVKFLGHPGVVDTSGLWRGLGGLFHVLFSDSLAFAGLLGATLADLCHIGVDFSDSVRRGTRFVPPPMIAPRGILWELWQVVKDGLGPTLRRFRRNRHRSFPGLPRHGGGSGGWEPKRDDGRPLSRPQTTSHYTRYKKTWGRK